MAKRKSNSRVLRELAEAFVLQLQAVEAGAIPEDEQAELTTSLVRQWVTYDGNATFLVGDRQVYLVLGKTPLGKPCIIPEPDLSDWVKYLIEDWKIRPEDLPEVHRQLNLGQSAEATNQDGVPLRLWVNPRERSRGVEPLAEEARPPELRRDYRKIAARALQQQYEGILGAEEMEELACSVARQWQKYEGHACLFDAGQQLVFTLTELDDGHCQMEAKRVLVELEPVLLNLGFAPEALPEVIARINLDQETEFQDRKGVRSLLWHDPKARRICVRPLDLAPPAPAWAGNSLPLLCTRCRAVLGPWEDGVRQQACPHCGHITSLPG